MSYNHELLHITPVHLYSSTSGHRYKVIRVSQYIGITVHLYTDACTGAVYLIRWRSSLVTSRWTSYGFFPLLLRTIFSFFRGGAATGTPKRRHNGTLEHRSTGTLMPWYTSTLVHLLLSLALQRGKRTSTLTCHQTRLNGISSS